MFLLAAKLVNVGSFNMSSKPCAVGEQLFMLVFVLVLGTAVVEGLINILGEVSVLDDCDDDDVIAGVGSS